MSELTREMVLSMEAGFALDALVAERVMGWCLDGDYWTTSARVSIRKLTGHDRHSWCPSTDIAAAWEVVETIMAAASRRVRQLTIHDSPAGGRGYFCSMSRCDGAHADTAPLAICRAALLTTPAGEVRTTHAD